MDKVKAELLAEAEKAIEEMLVKAREKEELTITDIEKLAHRVGDEIKQKTTQVLGDEESQKAANRMCPTCGRQMRNKGLKGRHIISETGTIWLDRPYYYCEACRAGVFPPGSTDGID